MSESTKATGREDEREEKSGETKTLQDVLDRIGPTAKRIMLAQPLNPFTKLEINIPSRGRLF